jgi:hypothetical protein
VSFLNEITAMVFWLLSLVALLPGLAVQWFLGRAMLSPYLFRALISDLLHYRRWGTFYPGTGRISKSSRASSPA